MNRIRPSTSSVLDCPIVPVATDESEPGMATEPVVRQGAPAVLTGGQDRAPDPSELGTASRRLPRGWGSHEERRLMLWGLMGFFLLGVYAAVFVIVGHLVWS